MHAVLGWLRRVRPGCSLALSGACAWAWAGMACDAERASVADASAALARHRPAFVALDRWARRTMSGAELIKSERALVETVFSKARSDRSIAGAWIEQAGPPKLAVGIPEGAALPMMTSSLPLRDAELGTLEVQLDAPCPAKAKPTTPAKRCTIVARSAPSPNGALRVSAAFEE